MYFFLICKIVKEFFSLNIPILKKISNLNFKNNVITSVNLYMASYDAHNVP